MAKDDLDTKVGAILETLKQYELPIDNEAELQEAIQTIFQDSHPQMIREYRLGTNVHDRVDFYDPKHQLAIECKVQGPFTQILSQCQRYCTYPNVQGLLLLSSRFMGFPKEIHGKPCYFLSLTEMML